MPKMLRHVKTGEIWPMNPNMARHPDVEIFDQVDPQFEAAMADDSGATLGDVMDPGAGAPAATGDHEFDDVPDYVDPEADSEDVVAKRAAIAAEAEKKAAKKEAAKKKAAAKRKATAAKKKADAAKAAAEAAEAAEDDDELDDLDLDDFDE